MALRILSRGAIAALAGAAMLAASSGPVRAFTLNSPSLEQPVAAAGISPCTGATGAGTAAGITDGAGIVAGVGMAAGIAGAGARAGVWSALRAMAPAGIAGGPRGATAAAVGSDARGPRERR